MSINGLSFASARPAPQPCTSVHQCGLLENITLACPSLKFLMSLWCSSEKIVICLTSVFSSLAIEENDIFMVDTSEGEFQCWFSMLQHPNSPYISSHFLLSL